MKPPFKHLSPFLVRCFLATLLGASASSALAVAPARPIINSKIEFTRSGFKDSGVDTGGNTHSYLIRWERKSVDEEGFRINITGAVTTSQLAGAGSQSAIVSLPGLAEGLKLNFTVTAWKYNGTVIESATSGSATFTIPAGLNGPGTFGTPTAFSVKRATRKVTVGGTEQTVNDDGVLEFTWTDNSTAELFNQIQYREVSGPANQWSHLAFVNFSTSGVTIDSLRPRLIPSTAYQFRIRATVQASLTSNGSLESSVVDFTTAPLTGPESLSAEVMRENLVRLTWRDNSSNETSYDISRNDGSGNFISLGQVGENVTSVNIPINQGTVNEWRVTAVHQSPPIGSSTLTTIRSANSNSVTLSSSFPAPTEVMAATSGFANTIDVSWKDNSNSEYGYNIYCRAQGETTYNFARAVPAGVTQISVNSQALTTTNEIPNFTPLQAGVSYEFVVRAVNSSESIFSVDSSPASANSNRATAKDGFTASVSARQGFMSQLSTGGEAGQAFTYTLATSNVGNRSTWTVSGLENTGLTFSDSTGIISGSQPMSGFFAPTATATFSDGTIATVTLNLRILGANSQPAQTFGAFPNRTLGINGILDISLPERIKDSDSELAVRMTTSKGDIDILLFPSVAPRAVANFMAYVNAGDYNGLIFQRLAFASDGITPFVLQTGSLKTLREPRTFSSVLSRPPVLNEPGLSHTEWTIGAAKQGARSSFYTPANSTTQINRGSTLNEQIYGYRGNPNSATTDFFINLGNNSANLDEQNSGFTAFGRIAVPSQATVNAIKALPRGRYLDNNTTNNYNASLDKRIIVDGFATEFGDIPMDVPFPITTGSPPPPADPALSSMDITKTVRISKVTSIPLLTYTATATSSPPGVVSATLTGTTLRLRGLKDNPTPATVTVTARDLDNRTFSTSFNVTVTRGHLAPAITRQPISQTVGTGNTATFNVTATGTGITYRWRKNGNDFNPPEATSTLTIPDALQNSDLYDVVIANDTTFVISNRVRLDTVEAPTLTPDLTHQLVEVGKPLTLTTTITGTPIPVISWKKNGVAFRALSSAQPDGSVITSYKVPLAVLANAGTYEVSAKNSAAVAAAQSTRVNVSVVDKKDTTLQVVPKTVSTKISAPFKGFAAAVDGYVWKKDGVDVRTLGTSFIGGDTAILTIQPETTEDFNSLIHTGRYTCTITLADNVGTVETGAKVLTVVNIPVLPPVLRDNDALVNGFIGVEYTDTLPYSTLSVHTPTSFSFSGLPPGLKFNTTTGVISGKPTRAGIFPFSATARNLAGPSTPTTTGQITIFALPAATVGTLAATISASPALNQNKGGRLNLTTLDTGAFTATVVLGKTTLRAAGSLAAGTGLYNPNNFTYQSRVTIPRTGGLPPLSLVFEIDSDRGYVSGSINDGTESASISGIRQSWNATWNPCLYLTAKSRFINLGLNLDPASGQVGNQGIPQGSGYMTLALSNAGVATITGRLSDGTSITGSSMIGPRGEALFFNMLYANTGSLLSTIDIGDTNLRNTSDLHLRTTGESRWIKDVQPASTRTYQTGIAETFLKIEGIHYYPPAPGTIIMGVANVLTTETNVQMDFSQGGLTASNNNPNIAFRLAANHVATYPIARNAANTFAVTAATGFYSGTFTLTDGRRVTYQGLTIPAIPATPINSNNNGQLVKVEIPGSSAIGAGYFLMPDLVPSLTTSKIYSGRARLLPPALAIATQPSPPTQAVNPGPTTTVTYTVAVTPVQTGITYRWRRNGIDISGATTATLTLSNVAESNQGSYDCVVSNGPTTVTSTAVILNVNDPITAVSASRSPADSVVAVGTKVTFTASAQGTNPNYQWRINNENIPGATSATFEIASVTLNDRSTYDVVVSNSVTTIGIPSNSVFLTVQ